MMLSQEKNPHPRRVAAATAGLALSVMVLSACSTDRRGDAETEGADVLISQLPAATAEIESLTWALPLGEPDTLDPINAIAYSSGAVVRNMCESLLATRSDFSHEPGLAEATVVSPTEIIFTVNENARFWDGTPVTAEDVAFSLQRSADPQAIISFVFINVASIDVTAVNEVTVRLSQPDSLFLSEMASIGGAIVQKAYAEEKGVDFGSSSGGLMCSGPFQLDEWTSGSRIVLTKNDAYWKPERAALASKVEFVFVSDSTALTQALIAGEIDGAYELPPAIIPALQESANGRVVFGPSSQSVNANPAQPGGPFADSNFREGFNRAINRQELATAAFNGAATPNYTFLTPATWPIAQDDIYRPVYDDFAQSRSFDVEAAQTLISESSYDGRELVMGIVAGDQTASQTAQLMQQQLDAVGVSLVIEPMPPLLHSQAGYDPAAREGLDIYLASSFNVVSDPLEPLGFVMLPGQAYNYVGYDDPEVNRLLAAAFAEFDPEARAELIVEAKRIYEQTDAATIPLLAINTAMYLREGLTGAVTSFAYWSMPQMAFIGGAE